MFTILALWFWHSFECGGKLAGLKLALEIVMPIEAAWNVSRITNEIQEEIAQLEKELK